jgi:UDP-glucose 6-dehydrogenase
MIISVAGIGYVGLSNAILLAQHNEVVALDIIKEKAGEQVSEYVRKAFTSKEYSIDAMKLTNEELNKILSN